MSTPLLRRRFTLAEYHRMGEVGILSEDDRVELIEGEIVEMTPINSHHAGFINRLVGIFAKNAINQAIVSVQNPVHLSEDSEPQPDLALLKPRADFYVASHPTPRDILLIIEVADTSLIYDRETKLPLYAKSGVLEVWILNIEEESLEIYRSPSKEGYEKSEVIQRDTAQSISPQLLPNIILKLKDIY